MGDSGRASGPPEHRGRGRTSDDTAIRQALESLYHAHYVSLVRLAALLTGDAIIAEEVATDALAALLAWSSGTRLPEPALFRLRRQVVIRSRRAARTRQSWRDGEHGSGPATAPAWRSAPVIGLLASLSASQREAVVLRHYLELTDEETAAVMGASLRAVRRSLESAGPLLSAVVPEDAAGCQA
jgi:DNA-directed RNA polymerase specialized sigma24 family protein